MEAQELVDTPVDYISPLTSKYAYVILTRDDRQYTVAQKVPHFFPCETMTPILSKRKWVDGEFKQVKHLLMPGYIFLFSNERMDPSLVHRLSGVLKVLQYGDKVYALTGYDEQLARWLARYGGMIGFSQAVRIDARIQVVQGPMKDVLCRITDVDKRKRCAKIELQFCGASFIVWMDFEWVEAETPYAG